MARTFSKYSILRKLGERGGHSTAFEARQSGLDRSVELRVLNRRIQEDAPAYQRFQREFRVLAALDHPALIKVLDLGTADGRVYYTTDFRQAPTLAEALGERGRWDPDLVLDRLLPVGDALALLHRKGVLHRDVGLQSLRFDEEHSRAYLATFALLKILKLPSLTERGFQPPGGASAHTPEHEEGWAESERTDVYLFASVLYQALTGRRIPGSAELAHGGGAAAFDLPPPSEAARGLASHLDEPLMQALAYRPEDRPASMEALLEVLRRKRKLLEMKSVVRTVGLKAVPAANAEPTTPEPNDDDDATDAVRPPARRRGDEVRQAAGQAARDVFGELKDWLDEDRRRVYGLAGGVLGVSLLLAGVRWVTGPGDVGGGPNASMRGYTRRRATGRVDPAKVKRDLAKVTQEAQLQATSPETFGPRWSALKTFVKSLDKPTRMEHFPPSVMAKLRVGFYRSPQTACLELDRLLEKAAQLARKS